jgi:hypothetical protein
LRASERQRGTAIEIRELGRGETCPVPLKRSGECAQTLPKGFEIAIAKARFNLYVCSLPNGNGADKQAPSF